jgi:hypothetical protein
MASFSLPILLYWLCTRRQEFETRRGLAVPNETVRMTPKAEAPRAGLWAPSQFRKTQTKRPPNPNRAHYGLRYCSRRFPDCRSQIEALQFKRCRTKLQQVSIPPWPFGGWRCANYCGVGGVALSVAALAINSEFPSFSMASAIVGSSLRFLMIFIEIFEILAAIRLGFTSIFVVFIAFQGAKKIADINGWLPILQWFLFAVAAFALGIFLLRKPLLSMYRDKAIEEAASRALHSSR